MDDLQPQRPALTPTLTGVELARWYWLKTELVGLARVLGISTSGFKKELTEQLVAVLDGHVPPACQRAVRASGNQLSGHLSASTVIPRGQRSSQKLRAWFQGRVGPSFRFDRHMRKFIESADGTTTLQDALEHWEATRDEPVRTIDPQFEFNRFTREWHQNNPSGLRAQLLAEWVTYRSLPIDARRQA